eukprot:592479_1
MCGYFLRNRSVFASYRSAIPSFRSISVLISIATDRLLDHTDPQNHRFDPNLWLFPSKPIVCWIIPIFPSKPIVCWITPIHKTILLIQICGYFHRNRSVFDCFWMALDP